MDSSRAITLNSMERWKDSLMIVSNVSSAKELVNDLKDIICDMDYEIEVEVKPVGDLPSIAASATGTQHTNSKP